MHFVNIWSLLKEGLFADLNSLTRLCPVYWQKQIVDIEYIYFFLDIRSGVWVQHLIVAIYRLGGGSFSAQQSHWYGRDKVARFWPDCSFITPYIRFIQIRKYICFHAQWSVNCHRSLLLVYISFRPMTGSFRLLDRRELRNNSEVFKRKDSMAVPDALVSQPYTQHITIWSVSLVISVLCWSQSFHRAGTKTRYHRVSQMSSSDQGDCM